MLFPSKDFVARVEQAACGLLRDSIRAVAETHPDRGAQAMPLAGGVATYSGEGSPLNKVAGLGFEGPPDLAELERVERFYAQRRCPVQVELSSLADEAIAPLLTDRGYRLVSFENVLGCDLRTMPAPAGQAANPDLEVRTTGEDDFAVWLDTVVTGFMTPDTDGMPAHESFARELLEEIIGDMARAPGFLRYLAVRAGSTAGAASMHVRDEVAQLSGASTLPGHRRRGVQTALLARRLADARHAGCDVATVTTQPGSMSQKNAQRNRFELLYTRAILVLDPPG